MKKIKLLALVLVAILMVVLTASAAHAVPLVPKIDKTVVSPDGRVKISYFKNGFAISEVTEAPVPNGKLSAQAIRTIRSVKPGMMRAAASGSGGTPTYSGSRTRTITTTYYMFGQVCAQYVTPFYWSWSGGRVTSFINLASSYPRPSLFYFLAGESVGVPAPTTYNGYYPGQYYSWKRGNIDFRITKYGVLYELYPLHQIWARGNGTWVWNGTP